MLTTTHIFVHESAWQEQVKPGPDQADDVWVVWNAHRPLRGDLTWEGQGRYGVHYAAVNRSRAEVADYRRTLQYNHSMDARLVTLVNNRQAIALAETAAEAQGQGRYGLEAYLGAYPGDEGARMFVERWDLPWVDGDTSADELLGKA